VFDQDFTGRLRKESPLTGPLEGLKEGFNRILVWPGN